MDFLAISDCETFQERIAPKPIEIDRDKLRMKFSALNVDFKGPSLEGIKERHPRKCRYFFRCWPVASFVKTVADKHWHAIGFRASREH